MRAARLAAGAAALVACSGGVAAAETRTVQGDRLVLTDTLSARIVIDTDTALSGIRISADGSLACLSVNPGPTAVVGTAGCDDGPESLRITVPPDMQLVLTGTGDGGVNVGDLRGALVAHITGDFDIKTGNLGSLVLTAHGGGDVIVGDVDGPASLETTGSGNVRIGHLRGPLHAQRRGSGDLTVGAIEAPGVDIESAGSGEVVIGGGEISSLQARVAGSGDLSVAARVSTGDVTASGGGDVRLSTVTGTLRRSASAGSDITVGGPGVVTDVMSRLSKADDAGHVTVVSVRRSHWAGHLVMAGLVGVMSFVIWRIVRRGRRVARPSGAALHPGVQAVCETMTRLDQRLGRLEGYVTTREFDLNRKFRELGPR